VGGTGKTPHVEYIVNLFGNNSQIATLSRGYKRKTKGFVLANENSDSKEIGDEPYQIYIKNKHLHVAVDEKRVHGVTKLKELYPDLELILLDDAFQHRQIKAGLSILLTDYSNLYTRDTYLPTGNLRESRKGSKRADIIIVTKCPEQMPSIDMRLIETELKLLPYQSLYFSNYRYSGIEPVFPDKIVDKTNLELVKKSKTAILLVAGIAHPQALCTYLNQYTSTFDALIFPDHYSFQRKDMKLINEKLDKLNTADKIIIVTEKDAARIVSQADEWSSFQHLLYKLPIKVNILNNQESNFKTKIYNYVTEDSRNSRLFKVENKNKS
jgi:tetraacyldisaccharide 4'-kinase